MAKPIMIDGKPHRIRRGKLVEIPAEWVGKVTYRQTINKRSSKAIHKLRKLLKYGRRDARSNERINMNDTCTCGGRFIDPEDWRDHMPCPGNADDRLSQTRNVLAKALVQIEFDLREHDSEYHHVTSQETWNEIKKLRELVEG